MFRIAMSFGVLALCGVAGAATWTVDDDGPADFNNIQDAVDAASNSDEVIVAPGTYTGTGDEVVDMKGRAITLRASGTAEETIIDGEGQRRVVYCSSGEDADTVIEGFTITGGSDSHGGGVYCNNSSPTISSCTACGNTPDQTSGDWTDNGGNSIDTECCPDPTNDGVVSSDDVQSIMNAWNCMTCDSDDVNFDGVVDVRDLLVALAAWGPCP